MYNIPTFEEFVNEVFFAYKNESKSKLKDGTPVSLSKNDVLEDDGGMSLGVKINSVITDIKAPHMKVGETFTRHKAFKMLSGPNSGTVLFSEDVLTQTDKFSTDIEESWFSDTPGKYKFKGEIIDAKAIPSNLKSLYDEMSSMVQ